MAEPFTPYHSLTGHDVIHIDTIKDMPTPQMSVSKAYYKRKLMTRTLGIWFTRSKGTCLCVYNQVDGWKVPNEIASMLYHVLTTSKYAWTGQNAMVSKYINAINFSRYKF